VNNLKSVNDKFGKMAQDLGLTGFSPQLADPLGGAQGMMQIQQGLNANGEMAVAYFDPALAGGDSEKSVVIFVPVSDYAAFLKNSQGVTTEGAISQVTFGQPMFAANFGQYAVLSPSKELVSRKPSTTLSAPSVTAKELATKDAVLYANFSALRVKLLPNLAQARQMIAQEMNQGLAGAPGGQKLAPIIKAVIDQMFNVAEGFLNEAQAATVALNIVPEGLNITEIAEFKPGYTTTNITSAKNTDASLLAGLPAGKYLAYGGAVSDPQRNLKVLSDLLDPIIKEVLAVGPEMAPAQDYFDAMKQQIGACNSQSFGFLTPSGALGAESVIQVVGIQRGDVKALAAAGAKAMDAEGKLMKSLDLPGMAASIPVYTPNAKTIDGVVFGSVTMPMDANAQDPMVRQQQEVMKMMYGPQGLVVHTGPVGDRMLVGVGVNDDVLRKLIASAKDSSSALEQDDAFKEVMKQLPKQRTAVLCVNVAEIATTALTYMKQFGFAVPVQFPPGLPPVGAAVSMQNGSAIQVDIHIPKTLVQSMIAAGMQAAMNMGGGPGGGGGPRGGGL
jgi:hypothetical protein